MKIHSLLVALSVALAVITSTAAALARPLVWFSPAFSLPDGAHPGSVDNLQLFQPGAPWANARSKIEVFKMPTHAITHMGDGQLRAVFSYLKDHHIAFAVEYGPLSFTDSCGRGVEGFHPPGQPRNLSVLIKRLGGTIDYIAMDEPLFYGHYWNGRSACHWPISRVAQEAAQTIAEFRGEFPHLVVGDIEPINGVPDPNWLASTRYWIESFRGAGEPLAFFHDDMIWHTPVTARTPQLLGLLRQEDVRFGVIFNSMGEIRSDREWLGSAEQNIHEYAQSGLPEPDDVLFQSWRPFPTHTLPESDPSALTYLVNWYFAQGRR
jgi:hypothetical protein